MNEMGRGNNQAPNCNMEHFKFQISLLQQDSSFIKSKLHKK